ncbi:BCCT family transporter [Nocardiopsis akebiae]|uniref:BCCT family transporter n=1 Tax=Nocardiopsis akebiae TaxID=2831968 RepID=A0ABX8C1V6_9ACTN|nr:BCCT family transporter [Nocardiopsis akebiae]QUX27427.1 BCCT family transporter [Nocardiopsis akebiae]
MTRAIRWNIDNKVFWPALIMVIGFSAPFVIAPQTGERLLGEVLSRLQSDLGWVYMWFVVGLAVLLGWLLFSRYGRIRMGGPDDRPEFSTPTWLAMIFTAAIGGGLMYWGIIEWAHYHVDPPFQLEPHSAEAAEWSATYPLFHWGPTAWAVFCVPTLALAYAYHVRRIRRLRLSEACRGVLGDRVDRWPGRLIDVFFILGMIGAAGTSLALAVPTVAEGASRMLGFEPGATLNTVVIGLWTVLFGGSVALGLHRGLKRLANLNLYLAAALGVLVLVLGPAVFVIDTFTNSVGMLAQNIVRMSTYTDPVGGSGFEEIWTVFYWGWWISYGPFVGMFCAKISKGRTVRQIIVGMCGFGSLGCWLSFALLGNSSMAFELSGQASIVDTLESEGAVPAIFATLEAFPLSWIITPLFLLLLLVFLATTLDSASYIMGSATSRDLPNEVEPSRSNRVLWAVVLAAVSVSVMSAGGTDALQTLSVVTAFPLIIILSLVAASLVRWLREDDRYRSGAAGSGPGAGAEPGLDPDRGKEPGLDTPPSPPTPAAR